MFLGRRNLRHEIIITWLVPPINPRSQQIGERSSYEPEGFSDRVLSKIQLLWCRLNLNSGTLVGFLQFFRIGNKRKKEKKKALLVSYETGQKKLKV